MCVVLRGFGTSADAIGRPGSDRRTHAQSAAGRIAARGLRISTRRCGALICNVEFGFAWKLADDEALIGDPERLGAGVLGEDDVRLQVDGIEVLFCHDSDVHVFHNDERHSLVLAWANRWAAAGGSPSFWRCDPRTGGLRRTTPEVG